jgi:hypothetical protein
MASETYKKRQKEAARREKEQEKVSRLTERRNTREKTGNKPPQEKLDTEKPRLQLVPKRKLFYFTRTEMLAEPNRKSRVTLYSVKIR